MWLLQMRREALSGESGRIQDGIGSATGHRGDTYICTSLYLAGLTIYNEYFSPSLSRMPLHNSAKVVHNDFMDLSALILILIILIIVVAGIQLGLLVLFARLRRPQVVDTTKEDVVLGQARDQAQGIIHKAIRQANRILVSSELRGINILAKQNTLGKEVADEFKSHIAEMEKSLISEFDHSAATAEKAYAEFLGTLQAAIQERLKHNEQLLIQKTDGMLTATETTVAAFVEDLEKKVKEEVEAQFAAARAEVERYKMHRLRVIDERIVEMLEEIVYVSLAKKLSLVDQSELAYKALEEAKRANAFVENPSAGTIAASPIPAALAHDDMQVEEQKNNEKREAGSGSQ